MAEITHITTLTTLDCCSCGMPLGLSKKWVEDARADGQFRKQFWCPYCNTRQGWGEGKHAREKRMLEAERDRLQRWLENERKETRTARAEAKHFRASRDGMKGVVAKVKKRVGHGVCPCCTRTFQNLKRHMETQHPDYASSEVHNPPTK